MAVSAGFALAQTSTASKVHKVAIHVDQNDPAVMNLALNNIQNITEYYKEKNEKVDIQLVAYGPGLHMLRSDTSPVKDRIATMTLEIPQFAVLACGNTQTNMSKQEKKDIPLISEAKVVPAGVIKLMELQGQGYAYIKP
jgi:intracellular sulfur oxidation DsrE/DsrF family protein